MEVRRSIPGTSLTISRVRDGPGSLRQIACMRTASSATIRAVPMEALVVALAVVMATGATIVAVVVLLKVVQPDRAARPALRPWATRGFPWLVLGMVASIVFGLLGLPIVLPLLLALAGLAAVGIGVYRQWRNGG